MKLFIPLAPMFEILPQRKIRVEWLNVLFMGIVLYLHHDTYTRRLLPAYVPWEIFLMYFSVGGFIFFSAYKLTQSKATETFAAFWKNRFLRIIPLYWLAVITFSIIIHPQASLALTAKHLLGLQMVFPELFGPLFLTLYFIGLLLVYYLFFSLSKSLVRTPRKLITLAAAVYAIAVVIKILLTPYVAVFFHSLLYLFPVFVAGMIAGGAKSYRLNSVWLFWLGPLWLIFFLAHLLFVGEMLLSSWPFILGQTLIICSTHIPLYLVLLRIGSFTDRVPPMVAKLSSLTYPIYLFHRPIWTLMSRWYSDRTLLQWVYICFFGTIVIVAVAYVVQRGYDKILKRLFLNKTTLG